VLCVKYGTIYVLIVLYNIGIGICIQIYNVCLSYFTVHTIQWCGITVNLNNKYFVKTKHRIYYSHYWFFLSYIHKLYYIINILYTSKYSNCYNNVFIKITFLYYLLVSTVKLENIKTELFF